MHDSRGIFEFRASQRTLILNSMYMRALSHFSSANIYIYMDRVIIYTWFESRLFLRLIDTIAKSNQ